MADGKPREVKVVLLGDAGVGKTSIVQRFVQNRFEKYPESTIGAAFMSKLMMVNDKLVKFSIWDTAGQEKYRSLAPMYYKGASVAILVYDVTRTTSFERLKKWVSELNDKGPEGILLVVAANKSDLDKHAVSEEEGTAVAKEISALFYKTSAKRGENIEELFLGIANNLPEETEVVKEPMISLHDGGGEASGSGKPSKGGCCG